MKSKLSLLFLLTVANTNFAAITPGAGVYQNPGIQTITSTGSGTNVNATATNVFLAAGTGITIGTNSQTFWTISASSASNATFNVNQFGSSSAGTNIKAGALFTNIIVQGGSSTNFNTNYFNDGSISHRAPYWEVAGPTGYRWVAESFAAIMNFRMDVSPNRAIYIGDEGEWNAVAIKVKSDGSATDNTSRVTFGDDFHGWRLNPARLGVGSHNSFGADPPNQCDVIYHDDLKNITFGNTNGMITLQGTNLIFAVTNGLSGTNAALAIAGMVTKNKGWTFYANMTNTGGSLFFDNNQGLWSTSLGGTRYKSIYTDDSGDDNLVINSGDGGIIMQNPFVAQSSGEFVGFVQCDNLTASKLTGTASDKKLQSITVGNGLSLSGTTLSVTNANIATNINLIAGSNITITTNAGPSWTIASTGGSGLGYLTYVAIVSQSGTGNPTATVLVNTLGVTPTWTYVSAGNYTFTAASVLTVGKTFATCSTAFDNSDGATFPVLCDLNSATSSNIQINVVKGTAGVNSCMFKCSFEVRVYP